MNKARAIRDYVAAHPGCTNKDIAAALDVSTAYAATHTSKGFQQGTMTRVEGGQGITGTTWYKYSAARKVIEHVSNKVEHVSKKKNSMIDSMVDELASSIAKQLANRIRDKLTRELENLAPTPTPTVDTAPLLAQLAAPLVSQPATHIKTLPKVGVVGLLPTQAGAISAEFAGCIDLVFWNEGDDRGTLKAMARNCEVVFLHTRHAGHATDQYLTTNGAELRRITGGVSNMKEALTSYFVGEKA